MNQITVKDDIGNSDALCIGRKTRSENQHIKRFLASPSSKFCEIFSKTSFSELSSKNRHTLNK